jgi:hypothetical protein
VSRLFSQLHDAVPDASTIVFGSAVLGMVMAFAALAGIWLRNGLAVVNAYPILFVYFYGGSLAFAPGLWLAELLFGRRGRVARSVGGALLIAVVVHLSTAAIFALQYRVFYSHWHSNFPSVVWFFQLGFTAAGGVFTFTVGSLAFYWPFSCLAFLAFGLWFASRGAKAH